MATEAERVVVALLADTSNLDVKVKQSAQAFGGSMRQIETSATSAERAVARSAQTMDRSLALAQQRSRLLGFQISDIGAQLSAGTSPFIVLAQQGPQVANALDGAKGAVGRFAAFLSGPWGAALFAATTILGTFIFRNREAGDSVDDLVEKLKEQAQKARDSEAANELFDNSLEGVEKAADDARKALDLLEKQQQSQEEQTVESIQRSLDSAKAIREETRALLEAALAYNERYKGSLASTDPRFASEFTVSQGRIEALRDELDRASASANKLEKDLTRAISFRTVEQANRSPEERINARYDAQIEGARRAAVASGKVTTALEAEIARINEAREAELKRMRDTEREGRRTSANLPPVTGAEIARALGTTITSGTRTPAQNRAARGAANSYHLSGQAIDIPLTVNGRPLTKAGIRAVLEPLGVEIKELLGPGDRGHDDHFHIAFSRRRRGGDEVERAQERAAEELQRETEAELRRVQAFQNELASMQGEEIDARQALITSAEELARLELEAIEISRQRYDDNLASLVEQKKLTAEEAEQLRGINEERAKLRAELVQRREDERKFRVAEAERQRAAEFASEERANLTEILEGQADLARTQAERRDLERRLLDLAFLEERARNDYAIAFADRLQNEYELGRATEEELRAARASADVARLRNESIPARQANAQGRSDRATMGPLEGFFDSIPSDMAEINEALESVAAGGLATFTDALTDAIVNFRSLKDVGLATLQAITAGIVRMAIEQVILRTVGQALGTAAVATTTAQAAAAAAAWAPAAAAASLATLGANAGPAAAALVSTNALATALAIPRRDGGPIFGPGGPRDDKVLMRASPGEYVIRASAASKLGRSALDFINLNGALPAFANGGFVAPRLSGRRAVGGAGAAFLSPDAVRQLEGIVARAIDAMPDVKLYPTLEPANVLRAALGSPAGRQVMFDFTSANSGKFNSSLQS